MKKTIFYWITLLNILFLSYSFLTHAAQTRHSSQKTTVLSTPQTTLRTFFEQMEQYRKGLEKKSPEAQKHLLLALSALDLSQIPFLIREEKGKEFAILLKETLDRVFRLKLNRVPNRPPLPDAWRIPDTPLILEKSASDGQYRFSTYSLSQLRSLFETIKHKAYLKGKKGAHYHASFLQKMLPSWLHARVFLFSNWQWIGLVLAFFLGLFFKKMSFLILQKLRIWVQKTSFQWDDKILFAAEKPLGWICAALFWLFALYLLQLEGRMFFALSFLCELLLWIGLLWFFYRITDLGIFYLKTYAQKTTTSIDDHLIPIIQKTTKTLIVIFGTLMLLQNFGINVMGLLAGLGIGGLAIALAAKDTCANFFGSVTILLDQPFRIGDYILVPNIVEGTIEDIGLRSTRIRTFAQSLVSVPNAVMANATIDNLGKRPVRRLKTTLSLTYDTPPEKLKNFVEAIKKLIQNHPYTQKKTFYVSFYQYSASSLDVLLYCYLKVPNWSEELIQREHIFFEIYRIAQKLDVSFAFPTQTIHIEKPPTTQETLSTPKDLSPA